MKRIVILLLLLVIVLPVFAQKKKIAILETTCPENNIERQRLMMIGSCIETGIIKNVSYEAYSRTQIQQILKEHNFQRSGLVSNEDIRRIGTMSGVDYVLVSEAAIVESQLFVAAKVLSVETGQYEMSESELMDNNPEAIRVGCNNLASKLLNNDQTVQATTTKTTATNSPMPQRSPSAGSVGGNTAAAQSQATQQENIRNARNANLVPARQSSFKPSLGFGVDLATNFIVCRAGIPVHVRLLKYSNKFNILVGGRIGWRGIPAEEKAYLSDIDSTLAWKFHFNEVSPFISFRYGNDVYCAVGFRMNYNYGYKWYYGHAAGDLTATPSYNSSTKTYNDIAVKQASEKIVTPITYSARFELGTSGDLVDLLIYVDWDMTHPFSESTIRQLSYRPQYDKLIANTTLASALRNAVLFGAALNIYLN